MSEATRTRATGGETRTGLSHRQILVVFSGLMLGMLLAALDQTVVATALPTIVGDLGGLMHLSWVVTAYLLASTATTPLWGKIGDLYGRKAVLLLTIVIFLAGSALCGLARSMTALIAFRAFQGLGAGGLMSLAMAVIGDIVSPRERGRYQGYTQAVFTLASVAGPLIGGFFVDHLSWRWVFYVNLPVGLVALAMIGAVLHLPAQRTPHRIDYLGAVLLVAGVCCLLLITVWGGDQYAWSSPQILGLAAAALALIAAFLLQERRAAEPVLPLRLFRNPVFAVVTAVLLLASCALFAAITFLPMFLQIVTGANATHSGLLLLPMMLGITFAAIVSGRVITRTGRYKIFPVLGLALTTLAMYLFSTMDGETSRTTASLYMVVLGLGFGMVTQVLILAVQNAVDRRDLGTATASANFFRSLGGSVGVAVFGAVLASQLRYWLPRQVPGGLAGDLDTSTLLSSPARIHALPAAAREGVAQAVAHGVSAVFLVATPIAALALLLVFFLKEHPLRGAPHAGSGKPAQAAAAARGESGAR